MEMTINRETLWHDGPNKIIVQPGEVVWRELLSKVPDKERAWMTQSINHKKHFFDLKFVPIKIRDWWAIIDSTWLSAPEQAEPTAKRKPRNMAAAT